MILKKIIAREFLYLLSTFLLLTLIFIGLKFYNIYQYRKIEEIINNISILKTQNLLFINKPIEIKKHDILQQYVATANNPKYNSDFSVINSKFPELKNYDKKVLEQYVATANYPKYNSDWNLINAKFPEFFVYQSDIDSLQYFKINLETLDGNVLKTKNNQLSSKDSENLILGIGLVLFTLVFCIRYLFYATRWSINTIKSK